jgi:hypothetical protein
VTKSKTAQEATDLTKLKAALKLANERADAAERRLTLLAQEMILYRVAHNAAREWVDYWAEMLPPNMKGRRTEHLIEAVHDVERQTRELRDGRGAW